MYWNVPRIVPSTVSGWLMVGVWLSAEPLGPAVGPAPRASPKSMSLAPPLVSMTLPGFKSRWTMPERCARSSASAISMPVRSSKSVGSGPRSSRAASVSPSINSITR